MRYEVLRYESKEDLAKRINKITRNGGQVLDGAKPVREKNKTVFYQTVLIQDSVKLDLGDDDSYVFYS